MPKLADPSDDEDDEDGDEGGSEGDNATKKAGESANANLAGGIANTQKAGGRAYPGTQGDRQGVSPGIGSAPVPRTPCKPWLGCSPP